MTRLPMQVTVTPEDTVAVSRIEEGAREAIEHIATTPIEDLIPEMISGILHFGIKVLIALLIYFAGAWLIRRVRGIIHRIFERRKTEKSIASFVESLTSISLTVILVIITVGTLGVNTTSLAAILAAGGMAIGMALSGTVQNFAGGIMILIFKPFKSGDFIETENGYSGTVSDVNIFSTKLTTTDNKIIIIPNSTLSNGTVNNFSLNTMRRVEWLVGVEYGSEAEKVKYNEEQYQKSRALIALQVKALIARDLFDTTAYFRIINPENASFSKAMAIIHDDAEYNRLLQPRE